MRTARTGQLLPRRRAAVLHRCAAALVLLAACSVPGRAAMAPQRVMSLNLCADQYLLSLLPRARIVSLTWLSRLDRASPFAAKAEGMPINYGAVEEVLAMKPDLVLAGAFSTPATRDLLKRAGIRLAAFPFADTSFADIRATTRAVASVLGAVPEGENLLRRMDATLAELARTAPVRPVRIALWTGDLVPGKGTLADTILTTAGAMNVAATFPDGAYRSFDVEQLLVLAPDLLAFGDDTVSRPGLARERLLHPVVQRRYAGRQIVYPQTLYSCGVPRSADAVRDLRRAMLRLAPPRGDAP